MTVGFSPAVSNCSCVPRKDVTKSAISAAVVGAGVTGALNLAGQQYLKSNPGQIIGRAFEESFKGKEGIFTKITKNYADVLVLGKFNWKKVGMYALAGAAIFGGIKALVTSNKNKKCEAAGHAQSMNYMA